jgi:uncharacterized protein YlzI (FlbEa/FlbD family)
MDSNEGNIPFGGIDIAIGRMIVNPQQAEEMVNKVIEYHDIKIIWKLEKQFCNN